MSGWIKIHRKITEWEWYDEPNTFRLFFHLLLSANHKQKKYRGVLIEVGQIMTGLNLLAMETSLSVQQIRTSLRRLKSTNEITIKSSTKGTIIQIVNYKKYQVATSEATNEEQTNNKPSTPKKNDNNIKNEKKIEKVYEKVIHDTFDLCLDYFDEHLTPKNEKIKSNWLDTIHKLITIDKIPPEIIVEIVKKTRADDFWKKNILT